MCFGQTERKKLKARRSLPQSGEKPSGQDSPGDPGDLDELRRKQDQLKRDLEACGDESNDYQVGNNFEN